MKDRKISTPNIFFAFCFICSNDFSQNTEQNFECFNDSDPFDVIIVPGVPYEDPKMKIVLRARMLWAKYLFEHGRTKNIIFSGASVYSPYIEGKIMKIYADSLHIPSEHTFSETEAEHSTENVYYSLLLAKKMGFKKIAVATDPYQAILIKHFIKKTCPDVKILTIEYDKIELWNTVLPEIDPSSAYAPTFVSLVERENLFQRFKGTLGKNIKSIYDNPRKDTEAKNVHAYF